jgi:DNA-directed RNA polymerase subunit RPC12/RpoP
MWARPEPLELTCPKCSADLAVELMDEGSEPIRCPQCGFRFDLDAALLEDGFHEVWPDEVEVRSR